ncbi:30S ribosomal protein S20 [Mesomycoplasma ovipneumoniae]|uniref:Small ribosomal subunit protein bS20 n=1 Tax=Mesomycoplasma ovipneumoniae TaxID=29562 RepID=A0AAW6Q559_9BACT|nr:30S ribosomal protein S20 [Mesomycoplasma ovipneumoniae]MDF9627829.1 30S ribosomal protein S20 [Mesomycoplasma ovipneumoniae]MDO4158072.1 30S ribosomal protein S20 [Mesomycoplasma ovipneumoniae]MDO4158221.1 30S ribosomal protein S20 [Mesomycoplasma ovipneumoniae]MDO6821777.1 30S ribosomal protein S20 [Mesomycoplasma ovipneumoniae]MDO6825784.1 30S ribosomal protein S20 [Mesomycoplasma ovipneumoniae]
MANIKSKIKSITKMQKARARNNAIKSRVKTAIKKAKLAVTSHAENQNELVAKAHKEIAKAKSKGVFHKGKASRKISRLHLFVNKHQKTTV